LSTPFWTCAGQIANPAKGSGSPHRGHKTEHLISRVSQYFLEKEASIKEIEK